METAIRHTHLLSVVLFLLLYLIKTTLLLSNKEEALAKFTKATRIPEIIISVLFLVTGIYMLTQVPEIKSLIIVKIIIVFASIPVAVIGFRRKKKALALLSMLMILGAYGLAEMSKKQKSKSMETITESTINGQEIYTASCARCHGDDGKSGLLGASDLSASTMDLTTRIEIIKNGKNAMTPFNDLLTQEQIEAVAKYSESLKK